MSGRSDARKQPKVYKRSPRKSILYVESNTDGTVGGSHFSLLYLVQNLQKEAFFPVVLFYQQNFLIPKFQEAGCKTLLFDKVEMLNLRRSLPWLERLSGSRILDVLIVKPVVFFQKVLNYFRSFVIPSFACWKIIRREKIDLIHLNNTWLRPQEWILASLFTRAEVVAHERGINNHFPFQSRFWSRFLKAIICISDAVKDNLLKHGFPQHQLHRIYNGLDPEIMRVSKTREVALREFGIQKSSCVVGMVGNIKPWKGQETLIRAVKYVREGTPEVKCLVVGDAGPFERPYLEKLQSLVKKEGLRDCVIFTGHRNDVPDLVNAIDVLVHASLQPEPFGRVLLEGMAVGKPVISTTIGAGPEIVIHGKTGLLVEPGNDGALAEAITYLLTDREKAGAMGIAGRQRLEREFTIAEHVTRIERIYRSVLQLNDHQHS